MIRGMGGPSTPADRDWFSRERVLALALGIATLLALYVCYLIVKPFIPALAFALALAVATHRAHDWLGRRLNNNTLTATIAVILVALVIIAPLTALLTYIVQQIVQTIRGVQGGGLPIDQWNSAIHGAPVIGDAVRWLEETFDIPAQLGELAKNVASQAGGLLAGSVSVLTQLVIMLFVLFFLYRDGREARLALRRLVPLSEDEASAMFTQIRDTILATVNGSLTVALVQSVLAGIMYTILGVPAAIVWGAATFIAALIPVFGTFMIWGPIAAYLAISGSWVKALVLVGWGMVAIGTIDNVLYPYLVGDRLRLHTVPTFFAILGGVSLFGPAGLILGPVALAITIGLLQVWWTRTAEGGTAEETIRSEPSQTSPSEALIDR
jgi:predicted PurR-regulated permease PerM